MKHAVTALWTGIPFGLLLGGIYALADNWRIGLAVGLYAGIAFGVAIASFKASMQRRFQMERPDFGGEKLIHEGPANHFLNGEGVGGWLYLTSRRLLFRSHRVNVQCHETEWPLAEVSSATPSMTLGLIPNGLVVSTASGAKERFAVEGRRLWSSAISKAKQGIT